MSTEIRPLEGKILDTPMKLALVMFFIAFVVLVYRFIFGIGPVTNLSSAYPWGIWIFFDVVIGTALACGGYAMALIIYVFNKWDYHPLIRPAIMASMFGYTLAGLSVVIDLGRWWNMFNYFVPQYVNINSALYEVAVCIMAYTTVLWIELSPAFAEKFAPKKLKIIKKMLFIFIAIGIVLPTMHQSSLGTLMLLAGHKLSPLWSTTWLPLLFLINALIIGYCMVCLEVILAALVFKKPMPVKMLGKLSSLVPWLILAFLIVRYAELIVGGKFLSLKMDLVGFSFIIENILYLVALIMFSLKPLRFKLQKLFLMTAILMAAAILYRFNAYIIGFNPGDHWSYFPSAGEFIITGGILSIEFMAYMLFVKKLPIFTLKRKA